MVHFSILPYCCGCIQCLLTFCCHYPRSVLAFRYCRCLCACLFVCVHQSRACPQDNSSPAQARTYQIRTKDLFESIDLDLQVHISLSMVCPPEQIHIGAGSPLVSSQQPFGQGSHQACLLPVSNLWDTSTVCSWTPRRLKIYYMWLTYLFSTTT